MRDAASTLTALLQHAHLLRGIAIEVAMCDQHEPEGFNPGDGGDNNMVNVFNYECECECSCDPWLIVQLDGQQVSLLS